MSLPNCLTLRTVKGSVLSWAELDNNFICLNNLISAKAGTGGNRWYIPSGETVSVTSDYQYFFYGDIFIEGTLDLASNSQLVVLNGNIYTGGTGTTTGSGSIYNIFLPTGDTKVTGLTYSGDVLTIYQNDGTSYSATVVTSTDVTVTGGTYDPNTGVATFYNNVGGSFPVSGFLTGYTDVQVNDLNYVGNTLVLSQTNGTTFSANTPMFSGNTSGDCITDLFVSNVNSCSPLHIQNISSGNVLIGENGGVNVGIGTSTPTRVLDSRGTFNLEPNANTFLRFDGTIMEAQASGSNSRLVLNRDNTGGTDLFGNGILLRSLTALPINNSDIVLGSGNIDMRTNNSINFRRTDNYTYGIWDSTNYRLKLGNLGFFPPLSSITSTLHVLGDFRVDGTNPDSLYVGTNGNVGINNVTPSSKLHLVGNNSSNGSYIRATQRTLGLGTISAYQNLADPVYSGYTRIDGIGTYFSNDLTYGETITSSGFTLSIYQIINNTLMYAYLNTGATFSNQSYTLQGNSRLEVGNNYFNTGNGNLISYDDGNNIFIGSDNNKYRSLIIGPYNTPFVLFDIASSRTTIYNESIIGGSSTGLVGNTARVKISGDGSLGLRNIGFQYNSYNGYTDYVIGNEVDNLNTTIRLSYNPTQFGYPYTAVTIDANNSWRVGVGTSTVGTHRMVVSDGLKLVSTPYNTTSFDVQTTGGTSFFSIQNNGNVGIGTSTPSEKLHVVGNTKITGGLNIGTIGSSSPLINLGLDSSGNVVTGTTGGGSTFTGGTISGPTSFTNGLTANTLTVGTFSVGRKFSTSESFTGSVVKTITHNLNTQDVIVQLWDSSNNLLNGATIVANNVNSVDITVSSTATYKVIIIG